VLGPAGFTLVELKYWAGPIAGDRYRLVRGAQGDTFDNPIRLANSKARILRGQLLAAYERITKQAARSVPLVPLGRARDLPPPPRFQRLHRSSRRLPTSASSGPLS